MEGIVAEKKNRYRPEIDGLRAFAVIAVIINHFNKDILPGGYLGVDIFFVISGYVITSSLDNRPSKNFRKFISEFYARRIKRLLPALLVFILITSFLTCVVNPKPIISVRTGITALLGASNFYLLKQSTDYFATSTLLNPFTHTWSLAVEEQFYILFPIFIWFTGFAKKSKNSLRNLFLTIGIFFIASLLYFQSQYSINQPLAYFLMPSRFWEMAAGCLIFIGLKKRLRFQKNLEKIPSFLILTLIILIMFIPARLAVISTISVVFCSAILLTCLRKGTLAYKLFTDPKIVYIGLISYSLYLWHWSVLSISVWLGYEPNLWSTILLLFLTYILAICSYEFIEKKFRYTNLSKSKIYISGISSLTGSAAILLGISQYFPQKLIINKASNFQDRISNNSIKESSVSRLNCHSPKNIDLAFSLCSASRKESNKVIVMTGDSMSDSLLPLANKFYHQDKYDVINMSFSGTISPTASYYYSRGSQKDHKIEIISNQKYYLKKALEIANSKYTDKTLWIFNDFNYYFYGRKDRPSPVVFLDSNEKEISPVEAQKLWFTQLNDLLIYTNKNKIKVILFGSLPSLTSGSDVICARKIGNVNKSSSTFCEDNVSLRRSFMHGEFTDNRLEKNIKDLEKSFNNFSYLDTSKTFCSDLNKCEIVSNEMMYMADIVHLSNRAALKIYNLVKDRMYELQSNL